MNEYQLIDVYSGRVRREGSFGTVATTRACLLESEKLRVSIVKIGEPVELASFNFSREPRH